MSGNKNLFKIVEAFQKSLQSANEMYNSSVFRKVLVDIGESLKSVNNTFNSPSFKESIKNVKEISHTIKGEYYDIFLFETDSIEIFLQNQTFEELYELTFNSLQRKSNKKMLEKVVKLILTENDDINELINILNDINGGITYGSIFLLFQCDFLVIKLAQSLIEILLTKKEDKSNYFKELVEHLKILENLEKKLDSKFSMEAGNYINDLGKLKNYFDNSNEEIPQISKIRLAIALILSISANFDVERGQIVHHYKTSKWLS